MKKKILILGIVIVICLIGGYLVWQISTPLPKELELSDFPEVFKENTVIVIGENASQIEIESAEEIALSLKNLTGNKPEIINTKKIESFKSSYNLIIVSTSNSNKVLEEVYNITNTTRVTEEYPGENKGVLEILSNPWNKEKAMLLVAGSDEWGVKAGSEMVTEDKRIKEFQEAMTVIELEEIKTAKDFVSNYSVELYTRKISDHFVLQNAQQIPFQEGDLRNPSNYEYLIQPPNIHKANGSYMIKLYTWTDYGGVLIGWDVKIEGQSITHIYAEVIDTLVGHFLFVPAEGFVPSPGIILINEKIKMVD